MKKLKVLGVWAAVCLVLLIFRSGAAYGQQTVFNVPSADVLERGKSYFEWDGVAGVDAASTSITPRSVRGVLKGVEAGVNVTSFNANSSSTVAAVPNFKWALYQGAKSGVTVFGGGGMWLPFKRASYAVGDNAFLAVAKTLGPKTRVAVGGYDYTAGTIDHANRGGIFASVEQTLTGRLGVAADWYSGNNSVGYVSPGVSCKLTSQLTMFVASEIGNHEVSSGNHAVLIVLGWNPAWGGEPH